MIINTGNSIVMTYGEPRYDAGNKHLDSACLNSMHDNVSPLIANGASPIENNNNGENPLFLAAFNYQESAFNAIIFPEKGKGQTLQDNDKKLLPAMIGTLEKIIAENDRYYYKDILLTKIIPYIDKLCPKNHRNIFNAVFNCLETEEARENATGLSGLAFAIKQNFLEKINNPTINDKEIAKLINWFYKIDDNGKRIYADEEISLEIYKHRKKLKKTSLKYFGYGLKSLISYYIISYIALIALHGLIIYGAVASIRAYFASQSDWGYNMLGAVLSTTAFLWIFMYFQPVIYAEEDKTLNNWQNNDLYYTAIRDKYNYQIIRYEIFTKLAKNEYTSIKDIIKKNHKDSNGNTLLHMAVMNDDYDFMTILLKNGADPLIKNKYGLNPLSLAISNKRKQAFDLILAKYRSIYTTYKNLVMDATTLNKDEAGIIASLITGLDQINTKEEAEVLAEERTSFTINTLEETNKYLKAIDDAMSKVMPDDEKYYYKLQLYNALSINYDKLSRISRKKHKTLFNTAFGLLNSKQEPDIETKKGKFEKALITGTQSLKESLLLAIKNNNDQLAAKLINWFYKLDDNGKRTYADEEISLEIYKHRKKLKKTSLKYFGYGLKALRSYYIISYAAIIALHGLIIYGAVACFIAYYASPLDISDNNSAWGYSILGAALSIIAASWISMYFAPVKYAAHNKTLTLKNCQDNEAYYNKIANEVGEDLSLTPDGAHQQQRIQ